MILSLSSRLKYGVARLLLLVFYLQWIAPLYANSLHEPEVPIHNFYYSNSTPVNTNKGRTPGIVQNTRTNTAGHPLLLRTTTAKTASPLMGGPSSPEATSFKPVGSSNLVNLFTGDFSYSIPLLDVGGYPVNLFYSGGITMEQEASWVGLGWNINPGSVSRNMRGIPDDFNGTDTLIQRQNTKPNRTWGGEVAADAEILGIKEPNLGLSAGFSYNNYLGPAVEIGATVSVSLPIMESVKAEKYAAPSISASLGAKLSSRSGLTFSPSLSASLAPTDGMVSTGIGLSTSYNSRTGISSLNLHAEQTKYHEQGKMVHDEYVSHKSSTAISLGSTSISFAKPSYTPTLRMPMQNSYTSGQVEFGGGAYGIRGSVTLNGYYSESKVSPEALKIKKPLVGYLYSEKAAGNLNAVMDFNRVNDAEVTPNTPIVSAPMYTYDVFSIQGEGTGGSIRAYRGELGFMRDNVTTSKDGNLAIGADIAPPGHYGVNVNNVSAPTRVGGWENDHNSLRNTLKYLPRQSNTSFENFYFRNPGESTVTSEESLNRIGHDSLSRFQLSGTGASPFIESKLELFGKTGGPQTIHPLTANTVLSSREKRTQVISMLTAEDASKIGLEKVIRNYRPGPALFQGEKLLCDTIQRVGGYRKAHHISEIDVLEQSGMRYVYGIPVYNKVQRDFTFSVSKLPDADNLVQYSADEPTENSHLTDASSSNKTDGYVEIKETPAYASSFLITGLLSPDYVDVTGDGITEDDLGGSVKFNYTKSDSIHRWRTPRSNKINFNNIAHFNEGKRSEKKDDKATISYGEREAWYLNSIESKSMIAIFTTGSRSDSKGVKSDMDASINNLEDVNKLLSRIDLYTKADLRANGFAGAKPVKSVLFEYTYDLCKGTPDNNNSAQGKLTLKAISFAYNGQYRSNKERYVFNYGNGDKDNPGYAVNASDRWGTYKPVKDLLNNPVNPGNLTNIDYPYTSGNKSNNDQFAAAWSLKKILLPSGGQMEIQYESDDYAWVQDRRACNMYQIYGLGSNTSAVTSPAMYTSKTTDNLFVYVKLPAPLENTDPIKRKKEIFDKYLSSLNQLAFKLIVSMPKGPEPLTVYATSYEDYDICSNSANNDLIYIKLSELDKQSPLAKSSVGFIVENLTGQAFPGYDASGVSSLGDFLNLMGTMFASISKAFTDADHTERSYGNAKNIVLGKSFIRLAAPDMKKFGGGARVKRVLVRDNWDKMTQQYASTYGQDYEYTTTAMINGQEQTISSGVASYEPGIGSEENPFREILSFSNKLPLASAQYGAVEMPVLEAFYPSPNVGYSKVTVRSIHRNGTHGDSTVRSAIGKQVTEYYTAKDFPAVGRFTDLASMDYKKDPFFSFFNKEVINRRIVSQGFLVQTNDMHGKMKFQAAYSEKDEKTPISASYHTYRNTGANGLNDKVDFVFNNEKGVVHQGNMGIDAELMTDVREFSVESRGTNTMVQVDLFIFGPLTIPVPTLFRSKSYIENKYRAVTCTKLINYHAIEDSVIVMDKGSVVSTKTIAYDAETGSPLVTKTANEFNDPIYNISYPAHWAYSGVGLAYKNIGRTFSNVNFIDGKISGSSPSSEDFESGDELYITNQSGNTSSVPLNGTITYICNTSAGPGQGQTQLAFNFSAPTTAPMRLYFGLVRGGGSNTGEGCDEFTFPTGISCITHPPYYVDIPAGVTTYTTPFENYPGGIKTTDPNSSARWSCFDNIYPTTDIYVKVATPANTYLPNFTLTNSGITLHNQSGLSQLTCIPASPNVTRLWAYDNNKNSSALTAAVKDLVFIDSIGRPYTQSGVTVRVIRSGKRNNIGLTIFSATAMRNPIQTIGGNRTLLVDSTTNVVSSSAISFKEKWMTDNDVITKRLYSVDRCTAIETDIVDCDGILEKRINPYNKGLLGNLKPFRSYTYYGLRNETDPSATTSVRKNGFIAGFASLWNFDINSIMVPDLANSNWVWNSELTLINGKGQELETRDALNRYTAGQYGYHKNMPVAMTQNAMYGESFADNFEDYAYEETLNKQAAYQCARNYIDFSGQFGTAIASEDNQNHAHSGKTMLSINPGQQLNKVFAVSNRPSSPYNLTFGHDTTKTISNPGGNITTVQYSGTYDQPVSSNYSLNSTGSFVVYPSPGPSHSYSITGRSYLAIQANGTYNFGITLITKYQSPPQQLTGFYSNNVVFTIFDQFGNSYASAILSKNIISTEGMRKDFSVDLCPGIYMIQLDGSETYQLNTSLSDLGNSYFWECTNAVFTNYKDLSTQNGCIKTTAIPASDTMINPMFHLTPAKYMHFSAWIREQCDSTVCYKTSYTNNTVSLQFNDAANSLTTGHASGNIIDGWQKVEFDFNVPADATTATLKLGAGSTRLYVDDIRIHPFNSNLKSYVYDPRTLRLTAELDENNYASFYDYDEEGQLIRVKKETIQGVKTIKETRSAKQQLITDVQ